MKKFTLFLIAFLGWATLSEAQTRLSVVTRIGASWGNMLFTNQLTSYYATTNTIAGSSKYGLRSRLANQITNVGNTFGMGLNIAVSDNFSIQPEWNFVQKGARYMDKNYVPTTDTLLNRELKIKLNYLEFPVLLRYDFKLGDTPLKGYLAGGMSVGIGLSGSYHAVRVSALDGTVKETSEHGKIVFGSTLNTDKGNMDRGFDARLEFGGIAGFGLQYELGAGSIVADVRYNVAINNLYKKGSTHLPVGFDNVSKNRVAQITIGYMRPLSRKTEEKKEEVKPNSGR